MRLPGQCGRHSFHGNLGAFARDAGHGTDADEAVMYFRDFKLEKTAHELFVGTRYGDFRVVVLVVDIGYHRTDSLALAEEVAGYGLALWQQKLVLVVIEQQGLF